MIRVYVSISCTCCKEIYENVFNLARKVNQHVFL
jgi:hypothetical protein